MSDDPVLCVRGLGHSFPDRELFHALDLEVRRGESVAVTGSSGSGKSTLLSCILGLIQPSSGAVEVAGVTMTGLRGKSLARQRSRAIGMVFQFGELLPELSPADNVALAALLAGTGRREAYRRAHELLEELGVPEVDVSSKLSGGERQRAAVARALMNRPALLIADEPTGALDSVTREKVADLLFAMPARHGCGLLVVTHDAVVAARASRVLGLVAGALAPVTATGRITR